MCSSAVISLENVSKVYESYRKPSHRIMQFFRKNTQLYDAFVALKDINLHVDKGETVGVIGRNGSGKSTLLQIIAGTLYATTGSVWSEGRVCAILELGAGFSQDFSGLENIYLNASIMGMDRLEIEQRIPDILEFSELGDFVYKPVKTYSSGMYVRLAFSVVINMEPDILIIDEALAVGDAGFQRKCFRKLEELKNNGVTILFVTHATDSVIAHCDRAVFLEHGSVREVGEPKDVVNSYLASLFDFRNKQGGRGGRQELRTVASRELNTDPHIDGCLYRAAYNETEYRWGCGDARIIDFVLLSEDKEEIGTICRTGANITIAASVHFEKPQSNLVYGLTIKTVEGIAVFGSNSEKIGVSTRNVDAGETLRVEFQVELNLVSGEYFFSIGVVSMEAGSTAVVLDRRYDLFRLLIEDESTAFGYAALPFSIRLEPQPDQASAK